MPSHKSEDYKLSAVEYYLTEDKTQEEVCKIFKCSARSLLRWVDKYNKNGEINNMEGILINSPEMSEYFLNKCSFKGVTVKYNSQATKKTLYEVKQFFNENLINK